eukprot:g18470.t2
MEARLWDALLADPRRFEFADDLVLALLLLTRGDLLQRDDVGGLAESLLAAPLVVDLELLLRRAYAICALRRQHGPNDQMPFPKLPEGIDLDSAVAVREGLSSLWGKVRAAGAGYWEALATPPTCGNLAALTMADVQAAERLVSQLRSFQREGSFCDVQLMAARDRLWAHRCVLQAGNLLQPDDQETVKLELEGIKRPGTLQLLMDRLYGAEWPTPRSGRAL